MKGSLRTIAPWIVAVGLWLAEGITLVSLWTADALIWVMLVTRSNERRIRPHQAADLAKGLEAQPHETTGQYLCLLRVSSHRRQHGHRPHHSRRSGRVKR